MIPSLVSLGNRDRCACCRSTSSTNSSTSAAHAVDAASKRVANRRSLARPVVHAERRGGPVTAVQRCRGGDAGAAACRPGGDAGGPQAADRSEPVAVATLAPQEERHQYAASPAVAHRPAAPSHPRQHQLPAAGRLPHSALALLLLKILLRRRRDKVHSAAVHVPAQHSGGLGRRRGRPAPTSRPAARQRRPRPGRDASTADLPGPGGGDVVGGSDGGGGGGRVATGFRPTAEASTAVRRQSAARHGHTQPLMDVHVTTGASLQVKVEVWTFRIGHAGPPGSRLRSEYLSL